MRRHPATTTDAVRAKQALVDLRAICRALPDVSERPSHGMPAWFVGSGTKQRQFAVFSNDHHGDGRIAMCCAAASGVQAMLVDSDPDAYYVPPYVGPAGWIGVRLDRGVARSQIAALVEAARDTVAAKAGATRATPPARRARSRPRRSAR
jgi:hypothetical protein